MKNENSNVNVKNLQNSESTHNCEYFSIKFKFIRN